MEAAISSVAWNMQRTPFMSPTTTFSLPETAQQGLDRIASRTAKIGVIGLGYVGLPLSLLFSDAGFQVTGFDIDARKVSELQAGRSYIYRIPGTEIQRAKEQGFRATADYAQLVEQD